MVLVSPSPASDFAMLAVRPCCASSQHRFEAGFFTFFVFLTCFIVKMAGGGASKVISEASEMTSEITKPGFEISKTGFVSSEMTGEIAGITIYTSKTTFEITEMSFVFSGMTFENTKMTLEIRSARARPARLKSSIASGLACHCELRLRARFHL